MAHLKICISKVLQSWGISSGVGDFYVQEMAMLLISDHKNSIRGYMD